jgi:hypothetical protein
MGKKETRVRNKFCEGRKKYGPSNGISTQLQVTRKQITIAVQI